MSGARGTCRLSGCLRLIEPHGTVRVAGLAEFEDMPTQGGTMQRSEHCPAVARHVLLGLRNGLFEVFDQTGPGGRQPFEMPPRILEVAQRVAD